MKFKGHVLKTNKQEYTLRDQLSEGGFSTIYTTSKPEVICKVQVISQANIGFAYAKEKHFLQALQHPNIVRLHSTLEQKINSVDYGFMLLENCSRGTALSVLQQQPGNVPEKAILKIALDVASALEYMHSQGVSHRDIKLENVLGTETGSYKLCDFGSASNEVISVVDKENRPNIQQFIQKTTTPLYRCPQQLDLYSGYPIGTQVDVFAMGVMMFMLCFKKQPFETRLSAINKQFFLPSEHPYSQDLIKIIEDCFIGNPAQRPTASIVKQQIRNLMQRKKAQIDINYSREIDQTIDQISRVSEKTFKKTDTVQSSIFDKIKRIYNQMTTQTEGWIVSFIEDNQQAPNLKFNRSIISKCWEKRYKVEKFYQILWKSSQENKSKSLVTLKLLALLHNFLRKGPVQGLKFDSPHCAIKLCTKIYNHWKLNQKPVSSQDIKRNVFVVLLIRFYCLIIIGKVKLCYQNCDILEGNYSIMPYLCSKENHTILKIPLMQCMIQLLDTCAKFHEILQKHSYLIDIQRTILLSIVDEQYCLVSTLTFILAAFKNAVSYVTEDLDMQRLKLKVRNIEESYKQVYLRLHSLFKQTAKLASLFEHNQFDLPLKVINHIEDIKLDNVKKTEGFQINKYINYKDSICGLKIPLTYEEVVKNPTFLKDIQNKAQPKDYIEINQYKAKNKDKKRAESASGTPVAAVTNNRPQSVNTQAQGKKKNEADFSSFTFDIKPNKEKETQVKGSAKDKEIFNTMEFTHQNLNKDFMTTDQKKNQFAEFMTIVDEKFQIQKKKADKPKLPFQKTNNFVVGTSQKNTEPKPAQSKQGIKKIQLINFFEDEEATSPSFPVPSPSSKQQITSPNALKVPQHKYIEEKKQMISQIKQVNILEQNFRSDSSFIDLKGFIVEEVKKSAEQYVIDYSALRFKKKIGFGHSSQVFKGEWRGREVAIKKIKDDMSSLNLQKQFKREIMTSVKIRHHPQLVTMIGVAEHENCFYIISQYCHGATLFDILHESEVPLPWATRISIARQIAKGMVFLHTNQPPIIHRDLKSLNVLLVNKYSDKHPDSMQIKIADFGLSRDFASSYMTGTLGTYHWMAPQIFNNEPYTLKADVYSFAIVLWEIAARKPPYLNMKNPQALMKYITVENGRPDISELADCPYEYVQLMTKCWNRLPEVRPTFEEILEILSRMAITI